MKDFFFLRQETGKLLDENEMILYNKISESLIEKTSPSGERGYSNWLRVTNYVEVPDDYRLANVDGFKMIIYTKKYWAPNIVNAKILVLNGKNESKSIDVYKEKRTKYIILTEDYIKTTNVDELGIILKGIFDNCYSYWHRTIK
ncbi:hypothetical protein LXJ15735_27880 [Lacrimispora xylanolytica]